MPVIGVVSDLEDRLDSETDRSFIEKSTDWYFAPKSFERSGKLYKALGVRQFKKLVIGTFGWVFKKIGMDETTGTYFIGKERNRKPGIGPKTYEGALQSKRIFRCKKYSNDCISAQK